MRFFRLPYVVWLNRYNIIVDLRFGLFLDRPRRLGSIERFSSGRYTKRHGLREHLVSRGKSIASIAGAFGYSLSSVLVAYLNGGCRGNEG
jgi:hypothetical protein